MSAAMGQDVLFARASVHLFRWDWSAAWVNPRGGRAGEKFTHGAWRCVMCQADRDFAWAWGGDCCPGLVATVPATMTLGGPS